MRKRSDNRRENLRHLIQEHDGPAYLAKRLGYANASFLVQMTGPNPTREVTEKTARIYEEKLGLEDGSLDWPSVTDKKTVKGAKAPAAPAAHAPATGDTATTINIIKLIGQLSQEQGINLPPIKFADVVALAIADAAETGRSPSPEHLRRLLALLK